jgi:protein phosphatase
MDHYSRDILDQCIGYGECEPETATFQVHENDLLILSTDGLYKMVPQKTIWAIVMAETSVAHKTKALVAAALDSGGEDNITVVLAKIHQVLP